MGWQQANSTNVFLEKALSKKETVGDGFVKNKRKMKKSGKVGWIEEGNGVVES